MIFECEIGLLYRRQVRELIHRLQWRGYDISYQEHKNWGVSHFTIKGDKHVVEAFARTLKLMFPESD